MSFKGRPHDRKIRETLRVGMRTGGTGGTEGIGTRRHACVEKLRAGVIAEYAPVLIFFVALFIWH